MTAVLILLSVVVALLALLVAGLLRSHAEILRRLHELGAGIEGQPSPAPQPGSPGRQTGNPAPQPGRPVHQLGGPVPHPGGGGGRRRAADLSGTNLAGDVVAVRVTHVPRDTVLLFLSSGCTTCAAFWEALRQPQQLRLPEAARLVVITRGPEDESPSALARLVPTGTTMVMSDEAWSAYDVAGTPYVVHVDGGSGRVKGEGTGTNWEQVAGLLAQATGDLTYVGHTDRRRSKAASDARRERRIDNELLAAGILPGDERLYRAGHPDGFPNGETPT